MGIFYFPCNFVYWKKIETHQQIKQEILDMLENNPEYLSNHSLVNNGKSTYGKSEFMDYITQNNNLINSIVWKPIQTLLDELNSRRNFDRIRIPESVLLECWVSKYDENATVSCHNHSSDAPQAHHFIDEKMYRASFSLIYIIHDTNERNQTEFIEPSMCGTNVSMSAETRFKTEYIEEIGEGTVIIFPSNLYHQVNSMSKSGRIIASFNIGSIFN